MTSNRKHKAVHSQDSPKDTANMPSEKGHMKMNIKKINTILILIIVLIRDAITGTSLLHN